jgi:hypothetical protein
MNTRNLEHYTPITTKKKRLDLFKPLSYLVYPRGKMNTQIMNR